MGRHGGGSRSGGRRSDGHSSSGGSKSSAAPFKGCYNRSYYHKGVCHSYYTNNKNFAVSKFRIRVQSFLLIFISVLMLAFILFTASGCIISGEKVNGNADRIMIQDTIDLLTPEEEQKALELFNQVYSKSGMPITLYTDDMEWKDKYDSIEIYSEELYYAMGIEEDAMIILFTYDGTFDWVYDIYCGDETTKCLSYITFSNLLDNFQKGMAGQNLYNALDYSLNSIMDELAKTIFDPIPLFVAGVLTCIYGIGFCIFFLSYSKEKNAYNYFLENPEKVDKTPMLVKNICPSCGAHNSNLLEVCEYCGTVLKM